MTSNPSQSIETDVLVVGAGPVGAALAVELASRGVRTHLVEQAAEIGSWWTRAMNTNKRSMEHLRRWGVAERLKAINYVPKGWPGNVSLLPTLGGDLITCIPTAGLGWQRELPDSAEDALWVAQGQVQEVLLEKARELGVTIHMDTRAVAMHERPDAVRVEVRHGDEQACFDARYVVGCDGARSFVREAAGISYKGSGALSRQVAIFFDAPGLLEGMRARGIPDSVMYICAHPDMHGIARLVQGSRWEFQINLPEGKDANDIDPQQTVRALVGAGIPFEVERSFPFSYFDLVADQFHAGRAFIAGDAAHIIPPLGGHNLNLGIGDAVNLGWKLAHHLSGWGGDGLLESYAYERQAMVLRTKGEVLGNYERLFSTYALLAQWLAIEGDTEQAREERRNMGEDINTHLRPQWESDGIVLDLRYTGSPIVAEGAAPIPYDPRHNSPCAAPGHRAPMHRDAAGVPLYDRFGPDYTLLDLARDEEAGREAARQLASAELPVKHVRLQDPALEALYGTTLTLVRPDQHVAWSGDRFPAEPQALLARISGRALEVA
jgi:2-polyprenyl-6-methoxyphenol hydroxylase-like FAD-dependent oxidoreductase